MIRYTLGCERGHSFESWFQNSLAYDKQAKRGLVVCPMCNSTKVEKAIMAPRVTRRRKSPPAGADTPAPVTEAKPGIPAPMPAAPSPVAMMSPQERELRRQLESHYRQLAARNRESAAAHEHLVDLLHAVRPQTVF